MTIEESDDRSSGSAAPSPRARLAAGGPVLIEANGVLLCTEAFGSPDDPALLLIGGGGSTMGWWDAELCRRLAAGGRWVIRYDFRDLGASPRTPPGYSLDDLVLDVVGLLDALEIRTAHLAGVSMGGGIAQRLAIEHADRVAALALLSTSPGFRPGGEPATDLPPMSPELLAHFTSDHGPDPDPADRTAMVESLVTSIRRLSAPGTFDEKWVRGLAEREYDRSIPEPQGFPAPGAEFRDRLGEITAPTVVLHGTEDPLLPYGHAEALAREIPGAELIPLEGIGHEMPSPSTWDTVIPALLRF